MPFLLANWRVIVVATLLLALGIQTWRLDRCQKGWHDYEVQVTSLARMQEAKNKEIANFNKEVENETIAAKDKAIADLSTRYANARAALRRVPVSAGSGALPPAPEAPALSSACEPTDRSADRLERVEAALLDALERADREMVKYRKLWEWATKVR